MRRYVMEVVSSCPVCGSVNILNDKETGEIVCRDCGTVITTKILVQDTMYVNETINKTTFPLSIFSYIKNDTKKSNMKNLQRTQRIIIKRTPSRRSLAIASSELDLLSSKLGIPRVVRDDALILFKEAFKKGLVKGRSTKGFAAATLYIACRRARLPILFDDIIEISTEEKNYITYCFRLLLKQLNIRLQPPDPSIFIEKLSHELHISRQTQEKAMEIIKFIKEKGISNGKDPATIAGAAVYIAGLLNTEKR
ncbi:MAG: transcription initiation factor IIB, partial [Thermoprotei archaeon]